MKKNNIFDTDIEMVDLDEIGNMEVSFDDMSEPNKKLGNDVEMVMKETQVFSSEDVEKAAQMYAEENERDLAATRVVEVEKINRYAEELAEESEDVEAEDESTLAEGEEEYAEEEAETDEDLAEEEEFSEETEYVEDDSEDGVQYESDEEESEEEFETEDADADDAEYESDEDEMTQEESEEDYSEESEAETEYSEESDEDYAEEEEYEEKRIVKAKTKEPKVKEPKVKEAKAKKQPEKAQKSNKSHKLEKDESYDFEKEDPKKKKVKKNKKKKNKEKTGMGIIEYIGIAFAVVLLVLLAVLGSKLVSNNIKKNKVQQFASVGVLFSDIDGIGNQGIEAIGEKAYIDSINAAKETTEDESQSTDEKEVKEAAAPVSVNFSSIEKDLKIKFTDKNTGKLITGIKFEVSAKGPKGDIFNWVDSDMDGMIYVNNLQPGNYEVKVLSVDQYEFPETATIVKVQDTVVYQVINVIDEAVDMSKVDLAKEDKQVKDIDKGETLQDTVAYVDSTATPSEGADGFIKIKKSDIKDPKTLETAFLWGGFRRVDSITLKVGESRHLPVALTEGQTLTGFDGSNDIVSCSPDGTATGLKAGNATIIARIMNSDGTSMEIPFNITVEEDVQLGDIPIDNISISGQGEVAVGASVVLNANISPQNASNRNLEWSSADSSIANVDSSGRVNGVRAGNTTIFAAATDGSGKVGSFNINVTEGTIPVSGISINDAEITVGGNTTLTATITPNNATNKDLSWSSSDTGIATVSPNGNVVGIKEGSVTITATANDGSGSSATANVTVKGKRSLKLTVKGPDGKEIGSKLTMFVGETYQLTAKVDGYSSDSGVKFSSSNNSASVSSGGLITASSEGTADISVTTNEKGDDGSKIVKKISVTIKDDPTKNTTKALMYTKDGKDVQVYYKNSEGKYVEAKWADYYKEGLEFYIKGEVEYKYTGWQTIDGNVYYFDADGKKVTGEQVIGGTKYNFASDGTLVKSSGVRGIDVSAYQGTIDWTAVKNSGISFVIIRCGFRGYTKGGLILDSKYQSYIQGATAAGLKVGLYIFSQAINESEAVEEASLCVNLAKGYRISYPIFIDSEYSNGRHDGRADGLDKQTRTAVCKAFCETIKSAGYTPGVYASKSWLYNNLDAGQLSSYKIWLAHYCSQTDYTGKYDMWQHSSTGSVSGISGNVDLDISYLGY